MVINFRYYYPIPGSKSYRKIVEWYTVAIHIQNQRIANLEKGDWIGGKL
jgi:hypothetical protein